MSPTRIHKIKSIENYRIFQKWAPSSAVEFARVNLIYGQNGSGKSTLANLLLGCAAHAAAEPEAGGGSQDAANAGLRLLGTVGDGASTIEIGVDDSEFWRRVRVFNKDFVRHNLAFGADGGPRPQALLTIGKINVDAEAELAELRPKLDKVRSEIGPAEAAATKAEKSKKDRLTDIARDVGGSLAGTSLAEYQARTYKRPKVEELLADFEKDSTVLDGASSDVAVDIKTATSVPMKRVVLPEIGVLLEGNALREARSLLDSSILDNNVIEELRGHPGRAQWVQEGLHLHDGLNDCLFCGQELTSERRAALNAHFDESYKHLQGQIDTLVGRLESSVEDSDKYLSLIPADESVYEDLRGELERARQAYQQEHTAYQQGIEVVVAALKEKKNNPFSIPDLGRGLDLVAPDVAALEKVVAAHSKKIDSHDKDARAAARRVELYHIKNFVDEYKRLKKDHADKERVRNDLKEEERRLSKRISELENIDGDPVPGADELTDYVARLLGRNELRFSASDEGKRYTIERNGAPASNLSEGEQTAIALLYFLVSVRKDKVQGGPPIVIIDDPVSSLDNEILFGASAHMWSELVENDYADQVFLMTHNFDLFRHWLTQLEARQRHDDCNYKAYEMRPEHVRRGRELYVRRPVLCRWETDKERAKVLRSEYHFLFSRVAHAVVDRSGDESIADQMNELALMPNAARRMLEAFLSFRCPGKVGSFHVALQELMCRDHHLDGGVRTRVERYLHAYSHFDCGDISQPLKLTETTTVLRSLFQLMHHVDPEHVSAMCTALAIDKHELLGDSASVSSEGTVT